MSRYRSSVDPYKHRILNLYRTGSLNRYRPSKLYPKPYRKPNSVRKYFKPQSQRGGRGRLDRYSKPRYFQSPRPEKKYELEPKLGKMSNPAVTRTPRYTPGKHDIEPWVDAEQIAKDVEKRLDGKLTERILEGFEAEFEELMRKVGKTSETSVAKSTEQELEPSKQEVETVERNAEVWMKDGGGQERDGETPKIESTEDLSEIYEGPKEDDASLEGSFKLSRTLGLAIPTGTDEEELERILRESTEEIGDKEYENETLEIEAVASELQEEPESSEEKRIDNIGAEAYGEIETEPIEGEVTGIESLEDIEDEEPANHEKEIEIEAEQTLEPLLEESELYPAEQEPHDIEII